MIGIISGSGLDKWPGLEGEITENFRTSYGNAGVTRGEIGGVEIAHVSRHGRGHMRLSNHVDHRSNLKALIDLGVDAVISLTVCGVVDPNIPLGSLVIFDDFYFPTNRFSDGSLCTWYGVPGTRERGHWIFDKPFSEPLRQSLYESAQEVGHDACLGGCYGHVDGPRFNSRSEIAALASHVERLVKYCE